MSEKTKESSISGSVSKIIRKLSGAGITDSDGNKTKVKSVIRRTRSGNVSQEKSGDCEGNATSSVYGKKSLSAVDTTSENEEFSVADRRLSVNRSFLYKKSTRMTTYDIRKSSNGGKDYNDVISLQKIDHLLKEICDTELNYISILKDIKKYLIYLEMISVTGNPDVRYLLRIMKVVTEEHHKLHMDLNLIKTRIQPVKSIGNVFLNYKESLFSNYPLLMKFKVRMNNVLIQAEVNKYLQLKYKECNDRLGLESHLLAVIQRLPKYQLLLQRLSKIFEEERISNKEDILTAITVIDETIKLGEDYITIDAIRTPKYNLFNYGRIKLQGTFTNPTMNKVLLLWFENKLVISLIRGKQNDVYIYAEELNEYALGYSALQQEPLKFEITDYSNTHFDKPYTLQLFADTPEIKKIWTNELDRLLWSQANKIKAKNTLSRKKAQDLLGIMNKSL